MHGDPLENWDQTVGFSPGRQLSINPLITQSLHSGQVSSWCETDLSIVILRCQTISPYPLDLKFCISLSFVGTISKIVQPEANLLLTGDAGHAEWR
jgi:hypothetical protein